MPREAPVMKSVLPLSDIKSPLACEECFEGHLRLRRIWAFAEDFGFLIDARQQLIGRSARQSARKCDRTGRQRGDLTRRLQAFGIDVLRRDYDVSDAELLSLRRVKRVPPTRPSARRCRTAVSKTPSS